MPHGDQPERRSSHRLSGREIATTGKHHLRSVTVQLATTIDHLTIVLRTMAHQEDQRESNHDNHDTGIEGCCPPAECFKTNNNNRDSEPTKRVTHLGQGNSLRSMAAEPVHDRHHHRGEPAKAGAHRDQREGQVELEKRRDLAERHKSNPEDHNTHTQHNPGAILVS